MTQGRSPFPVRDFFGRLQNAHKLAGDAGVQAMLCNEGHTQMLMGILAVASEMEITPEWQATRMRMWSAAKHDQSITAKDLVTRAALRYEKN
jgi:hypothetical protein